MKIRKLEDEAAPLKLLLSADPSLEHINDYLRRGNCYIAEEDSTLQAVYVLLPTKPGTVELVNIAIEEKVQNRGIGKLLVKDAVSRARLEGFKKIEVGTGNSSIDQLAFYQKCGFRIVGVEFDFFTDYEEEIIENGIKCKDMIRLAQVL
ncbi:GNAT family N-acetyltransferase [Niallia taxi]|uniref:GNAT family N-acetyltransferase n=1 Tax=Niallia taxi TaxID=2499688 RepID=A0A3S2TVZ6_9BACI|nr:GNAT family N-acetyltransferase [Niallia taxi]MED4056250.1 GNAT family N-acetyltransferase [Niallia taxi]MED4119735.1 GNAT family N-acetyltransferase [Niallia taxi]RVT66947.1 GNAT family N-acetyltransferase [Niallia taxi]